MQYFEILKKIESIQKSLEAGFIYGVDVKTEEMI